MILRLRPDGLFIPKNLFEMFGIIDEDFTEI